VSTQEEFIYDSTFKTIISSVELERSVIETLQAWLPTYLREVERQMGRTMGQIPPPRSYSTATTFESENYDQMPAILVVSPGLFEEPESDGDGTYAAVWSIGVAAIVAAKDEVTTREVARIYGAAIRAIMLHHQIYGSLKLGAGTTWLDESYDDIPELASRSLQAAQLIFTIRVDDVVTKWAGPLEPPDPDTQPGADWPTVETVEVNVEQTDQLP
jgi:hypothetical protein